MQGNFRLIDLNEHAFDGWVRKELAARRLCTMPEVEVAHPSYDPEELPDRRVNTTHQF